MWGDFCLPLIAYLVTLLVLTAGAAAFHRLRALGRARLERPDAPVLRLAPPATHDEGTDDRRAA